MAKGNHRREHKKRRGNVLAKGIRLIHSRCTVQYGACCLSHFSIPRRANLALKKSLKPLRTETTSIMRLPERVVDAQRFRLAIQAKTSFIHITGLFCRMSSKDQSKKEQWPDDWPVQSDDPLAEELHLEQPFLATGPSLAMCSGSDIHLAKTATASNKQRCLALLPGIMSLKPPEANKEDNTATVATATATTSGALENPEEDNDDDKNNTNTNNKPKASDRTVLGHLIGLETLAPTLILGGGGAGGDAYAASSFSTPTLQLQGRLLPSTSKFLVLTLQPKKKRVVCKHIFDSVVVFGEPQAVIPQQQQQQQEEKDEQLDIKMPADAIQDEAILHYGCSLRTVDGGSGTTKNGELSMTMEDLYLNEPVPVGSRGSGKDKSAVHTPAKTSLLQESKHQPNMDKPDEDSSSEDSVFEGNSFVHETLGRRATSQRKSRKTVRYSEAGSSEEDDENNDDSKDDDSSDEDNESTKRQKKLSNKKTSSGSRRSITRKPVSSKVTQTQDTDNDDSDGEHSAVEDYDDEEEDDDDEAYVDQDASRGTGTLYNQRSSTRKRKNSSRNRENSVSKVPKRQKKLTLGGDDDVEIIEVKDDDNGDEDYVDPDAVTSRGSSYRQLGSSRKGKSRRKEKNKKNKADMVSKHPKELKQCLDSNDCSGDKAKSSGRKRAVAEPAQVTRKEETQQSQYQSSAQSNAISPASQDVMERRKHSQMNVITKKVAAAEKDSGATADATGQAVKANSDAKQAFTPSVAVDFKSNGKTSASNPEAKTSKGDVSRTGSENETQQIRVKSNPQMTESKVVPETQSTPGRRRRRKHSTPSTTSPARRKLDLSDNDYSFLG